ncbi:hypothetical protein W97_01041 [Coniosporium apollinis CBS 100218]|uniref:HOOK N-terminal domain-containing protein n=1 Tax=Coniosporium apollinis (strain CBS 100218) TaxID=1168221 RepID=R7YJ42_CONA1|nr:uncharacterized protein W97_01041 [Coniosporium apollinis CBS 100218]EON61824.1 hypothetical protein W97_01041 [Coniosporium apollinis CBS 100218]
MDPVSPELASALLQWVNSFNEVHKPVGSWKELEDGQILWKILVDLDPAYFQDELPEPDRKSADNWIPRWQNLKRIDRMVRTYIREECDRLPNLSKTMSPNLKAIAIEGSKNETIKLTRIIVLASMYSRKTNARMGQVLIGLGPKVSRVVAKAIQQAEALDKSMAESGAEHDVSSEFDNSTDSDSPSRPGPGIERDPELEREERLIQAQKENQELGSKILSLTAELTQMRNQISTLEEELVESKLHLDQKSRAAYDDQAIEQLEHRAQRDKDYIAELESDLANSKAQVDNQERLLGRLKADAATKQDLRDELQLIKTERDDLLQKAKMNENLKKKIQGLQEQEKANSTLRADLADAVSQLEDLQRIRDRCAALEKANEENSVTIANGEQEIFESKRAKKQLEHELRVLQGKAEQRLEMQIRAEETVRDLQQRLREAEAANTRIPDSLGNELEHAAETEQLENRLVISETLLHWNRLLMLHYRKDPKQTTSSVGADGILLHQKLDMLEARCKKLEEQYLDVYQENLGLQDALKEGPEKEDPFIRQRDQLHHANTELAELKAKYYAAMSENADLKHQLTKFTSAADGADTLDEKTQSDFKALTANHEELLTSQAELEKHAKGLQTELVEKSSLLRHALLSREAVVKEPREARQTEELKLITQRLDAVRTAPTEEAQDVQAKVADGFCKQILDLQDLAAAHMTVSNFLEQDSQKESLFLSFVPEAPEGFDEAMRPVSPTTSLSCSAFLTLPSTPPATSAAELKYLQARLNTPQDGPAQQQANQSDPSAESSRENGQARSPTMDRFADCLSSTSQQQDLQNLQRENKLIASAWYDMGRRLQSNTVVLQRRVQDPKSWIGKQRMAVGQGGGVSGIRR